MGDATLAGVLVQRETDGARDHGELFGPGRPGTYSDDGARPVVDVRKLKIDVNVPACIAVVVAVWSYYEGRTIEGAILIAALTVVAGMEHSKK